MREGWQWAALLAEVAPDNLVHCLVKRIADHELSKGSYLSIHTGFGTPNMQKLDDGTTDVFFFYWGKKSTIFQAENWEPAVLRLTGIGFIGTVQQQTQADLPAVLPYRLTE